MSNRHLLAKLAGKIKAYRDAHHVLQARNRLWDSVVGLLSIGLSTIASAGIFKNSQQSTDATSVSWMLYVAGVASALAACLGGVEKVCKFATKTAEHKLAFTGFEKLGRRCDVLLADDLTSEGMKAAVVEVSAAFDDLIDKSPSLPERMVFTTPADEQADKDTIPPPGRSRKSKAKISGWVRRGRSAVPFSSAPPAFEDPSDEEEPGPYDNAKIDDRAK